MEKGIKRSFLTDNLMIRHTIKELNDNILYYLISLFLLNTNIFFNLDNITLLSIYVFITIVNSFYGLNMIKSFIVLEYVFFESYIDDVYNLLKKL